MKVGRYELVKRLDRGFLGPLWVVRFDHEGESLLGMARVIELDADSPEEVRDQLTESAWEAPELSGRGAVCAADVVFEDDRFALIDDYIEGQPLSALESMRKAKRVKLPIELALRFGLDLIAAIELLVKDAQDASIDGYHGGVGLDTVLVGTDGKAYLLDPLVAATATTFEAFRLRPERAPYVAPEQWRGVVADEKSDVYSVGCIIWELLANRRLHVGGPSTIQRRLLEGEELPELPKRPGVPQALTELLSKAVALESAERPTLSQLSRGLQAAGPAAANDEVAKFVEALAKAQLSKQRAATEHSAIGRVAELVRQERAQAPVPKSAPSKWRPVWTKNGKRAEGGLRGRSAAGEEVVPRAKPPAMPRMAPPNAAPPPAPARRTAARGTLLGLSPVQLAAASALAVEPGPDSEEPTQVVALDEQARGAAPPVSAAGRRDALPQPNVAREHIANEHPTPVVPRNMAAPEPPPIDRVSRPSRSATAAPTFDDVVVPAPTASEAPSALTASELSALGAESPSRLAVGKARSTHAGQPPVAQRHSDSEVTPRPLALPPIAAIKRAPPVVWFMAGICTTLIGVIVILLLREPPTTYPAPMAEQQSATQGSVGAAATPDRAASDDEAKQLSEVVDTSDKGKSNTTKPSAEEETTDKSGSVDAPQQGTPSETETVDTANEIAQPSTAKASKAPTKRKRVYRPKPKKKANSDFIPRGL